MVWKNQAISAHAGDSPSGKAPPFGGGIRGFESLIPCQICFMQRATASTSFLAHTPMSIGFVRLVSCFLVALALNKFGL